jgi:hypothetical protein
MTWRNRARCRGMDPDLFDIDAVGNAGTHGLRVCTGLHPSGDYIGDCPVRTECLTEALGMHSSDDYGVLGGTTMDARSKVRAGQLSREKAMAGGNRQALERTRDEKLALRAERLLDKARKRIA